MTHHIAPNDTINKNTPAEMANQTLSETRADTIKMMIKNTPNVIINDDKSILLSPLLIFNTFNGPALVAVLFVLFSHYLLNEVDGLFLTIKSPFNNYTILFNVINNIYVSNCSFPSISCLPHIGQNLILNLLAVSDWFLSLT